MSSALAAVADALTSAELTPSGIREAISRVATSNGMRFGDVCMEVRLAVTGKRVSPPLFESMALLAEFHGREELLRRLREGYDPHE